MRYLITGGAGFIGSHYVRSLLVGNLSHAVGAEPTQVTVLDKLTYAGVRANLDPVAADPRLAFVHGDILDEALVDRLVADTDVLVHFAAESHVDRSIVDPSVFVTTNVVGTRALLDTALRHDLGRFVHISTNEVYGPVTSGSCTESQPLAPSSPYSASKASSDLLVLAYQRTYGLPAVVTRCSNNYGPYQFPEKLIPLFVTNLLDGRSLPLYGDGHHMRDWLHVDDHCRGIQLVLENGSIGQVYNIGGGTELSNRRLAELLLEAVGANWSRVEHEADRPGHDERYSLDFSKASVELGYRPRQDFADGLAATVSWYRDNRSWWEPLRTRARPRRVAGETVHR